MINANKKVCYRGAMVLAAGATLALIWLSLGVGIIGEDGNRANILYLGVAASGFVGATIARFRPAGMARAMFVVALLLAAVGAFAVMAGLGEPWSGPLELIILNGVFVFLFGGAARLFRCAVPT